MNFWKFAKLIDGQKLLDIFNIVIYIRIQIRIYSFKIVIVLIQLVVKIIIPEVENSLFSKYRCIFLCYSSAIQIYFEFHILGK